MKSVESRVCAMADELAGRFGVSNAEKGRVVAEEIYATGEEDLCVAVLAKGADDILKERGKQMRRAADRAVRKLATGQTVEKRMVNAVLQWEVPGETPMPLIDATPALLVSALDLVRRQRQAQEELEQHLVFLVDRTAGHPRHESIRSLIRRGALAVQDLFWRRA